MWEVRQNGIRYCHCGLLADAVRVAAFGRGRTIHKVLPPVEPETVNVSAEDLGRELCLKPQLILEQDLKEPLDL